MPPYPLFADLNGHAVPVAALPALRGRAPGTPPFLERRGISVDQRPVTGRLEQWAALAPHQRIRTPALPVVGETAALAPRPARYGRCIRGGAIRACAA